MKCAAIFVTITFIVASCSAFVVPMGNIAASRSQLRMSREEGSAEFNTGEQANEVVDAFQRGFDQQKDAIPGKHLGEDVSHKASEIGDNIKDAFSGKGLGGAGDEAQSKLKEAGQSAQDKASSGADAAQRKAGELKDKAANTFGGN